MMSPSSSNASTISHHSPEYIDLPDDNIEVESAQSDHQSIAGQRHLFPPHRIEIELAHGTPAGQTRGFDRSYSDSQMDVLRPRHPLPRQTLKTMSLTRDHEINFSEIHSPGEIEEAPHLTETQPLLATHPLPSQSHFFIDMPIDPALGTGTSQISLNAPSSKASLGDRLKSAFLFRCRPRAENKEAEAAESVKGAEATKAFPTFYSSALILKNKPDTGIARVTAKDPVINALFQYGVAGNLDDEWIMPENGASLTFKFSPHTVNAYKKLKTACTIKAPSEDTSDEEKEGEGNLLIPILLQVVQYGKKGLGANATIENEAGQSLHIYDYLAALSPEISSDKDCAGALPLAEMIQHTIAQDPDLKARLAAASLLQLATKKEFELKTVGLSALSVAISGIIGSAWEFGLAPLVNKAIFGKHFSPTKVAFGLAGIYCVPSFASEFIDTMLIKAMIKTLNKESWSFKALLPDGIKGGAIAAAGAYFNNLLQFKSTGSKGLDIACNTVTTEVAVLSAASGVPMEVKENEAKMNEALKKALANGLFDPLDQQGETAEQYITRLSKQAREIAPGDSIAQKSITLAGIIGLVPLILSDKITGAIPKSVLRILNVTLFNPIEAITINTLIGTSKLSIPGIMTSDKEKHAQVLKLIFEKAQLSDNKNKNENENDIESRDISDKELNDIFHPTLEYGFQAAGGKTIDIISFPFIKAGDCIDAMEIKKRMAPFAQRLKQCVMRQQATTV